jgi:putative peptide zinc metalloprotease protein
LYALTGFEPLLLMIPIQNLEILHQFLPFIRLDGYYIVSDLTGVPDMFARIRPTLASLVPGKPTSDRVKELKPWVRVAVTVYVFTVVPLLLFLFGMMIINAPRIFSTAYDAFFLQYYKVKHDFNGGSAFSGAFGVLQMLILLLPAAGIVAMFGRAFVRLNRGLWTGTTGRPIARLSSFAAVAALVGFIAWLWYPNSVYRPIQPGEKGTLAGAVSQFAAVPTGRPALTPQRLKQLHDAPFRSSQPTNRPAKSTPPPTQTTGTSTTGTTTTPVATTSATTTTPTDTTATSTTDTTTTGP